MKILIVDDGPLNLKLLRAVLEGEKQEVLEAANGEEAIAILEREPVDAIISDILMPGMDGYRLCQEVRKSERWRHTPFIFHTATYSTPSDEKLCYDLGGDKYLLKPAPVAVLMEALNDAASKAKTRPAPRREIKTEVAVMKEYNERLVNKLEQKVGELELAKAELQRANEELETRVCQRTAELEKANEELESFAYSVSHDLRAPLRHINGYIEAYLREASGNVNPSSQAHLQSARGSSRKLGQLIDALLELSRTNRAEMEFVPVNLSLLAAELLAELQRAEPDRLVKLKIAPNLVVNGDRPLLRIVMANLLSNAWKYSRKKAEARIEFGKTNIDRVDNYFVRDNGAGFDMTYAGKLFRPFQRLHSSFDFEGSGIGLATVQRIIDRHNGTIRAEGHVDHGATFYFTVAPTESSAPDRD